MTGRQITKPLGQIGGIGFEQRRTVIAIVVGRDRTGEHSI
jgi:hypothetical protein